MRNGISPPKPRYQECPWYVRLWRRRWYLTIPIQGTFLWIWSFSHRREIIRTPDGAEFQHPRMGFLRSCGLAKSMAQAKMNWVYTMDEVMANLGIEK